MADVLWQRLKGRSPTERVLLVKYCREFRSWALMAASDWEKVALVALLALRVARLVREEELFSLQLVMSWRNK